MSIRNKQDIEPQSVFCIKKGFTFEYQFLLIL